MAVLGRRMGGPVRHLAQRAGEEGGRRAGCRLGAARRGRPGARGRAPRARRRPPSPGGLRLVAGGHHGRSRGARRRGALAGAAGVDGHLRPAFRPDPLRARVPGPRGPARGRVRRLVRVLPRSTTSDPARHGTFRDAERALPRIAGLGFDVVYLPPIHPIGRTHRKGHNNALDRRAGRSRQPLGHRQRATGVTPRSIPSSGRSTTSAASCRPRARSAWRWRSTSRSSARRIIPG